MKRKQLTEEEFCKAVLHARNMTCEEKIKEGIRLFVEECEEMASEIRREMPGASEDVVQATLRARVEEERKKEEEGFYFNISHFPNVPEPQN
jgi:hypothetical protein